MKVKRVSGYPYSESGLRTRLGRTRVHRLKERFPRVEMSAWALWSHWPLPSHVGLPPHWRPWDSPGTGQTALSGSSPTGHSTGFHRPHSTCAWPLGRPPVKSGLPGHSSIHPDDFKREWANALSQSWPLPTAELMSVHTNAPRYSDGILWYSRTFAEYGALALPHLLVFLWYSCAFLIGCIL